MDSSGDPSETIIWTENVYDASGRVIEVILPGGAKVKTDYSVSISGKIGTSKQITDQAGKKRKGISDALGRMIRVIEDPDGLSLNTDYEFDTLGNLRKTTQGVQSRYFMHDSLGRLLYSKQPEEEVNTTFNETDSFTSNSSWSNKYEYDNNGNITSTTNAKDGTVTAIYDKLNRVIRRDYDDNTPDVSLFYDGTGLDVTPSSVPGATKGKTTKIANTISETRYTSFDVTGRLLTHEQRTTSGQLAGTETPYQTSYTYNLAGAVLTETYPSGRVMNYSYRADGELNTLTGTKAGQTNARTYLDNISYNTLGNIEKMQLGNGTWEAALYNERQQVKQISLGHTENDKSLLKIDYEYGLLTENNGSLSKQTISYTGLSNPISQDYTYDAFNRLKTAEETSSGSQSWKQTFDYDRFGNRTFNATGTTTLTQNNKVTNPTIEASNNRLTEDQDSDSVVDYDYDKSGNVTLDATNQRFIYDAENRIKTFFRGTNSSTNEIDADATYEYDGDSKRVRKIADGVETIFVYNASGQLVAEYSTELPTNPKVSYLTEDHLGSPRIITDGIKATVSRHDYMAFGDEVTETVGNVSGRTSGYGYGENDDIRKQYTGYERDKEYAQARYYNSSHGRFTSVDPLTASANVKNPQTFNRYSYVMNSPYKFTDPLGLLSVNSVACGSCGGDGYGGGGAFNSVVWGGFSLFTTSVESVTINNGSQSDSTAAAVHEAGHAVASPQAQTASQQVVHLGKDKTINQTIDNINDLAKPVVGESREFARTLYVPGDLYVLNNATILDADGNFYASGVTGYIRPVAVLLLDQNGNIINSRKSVIIETLTPNSQAAKTLYNAGVLSSTQGKGESPASNGVFYDIQGRGTTGILYTNIDTTQDLEIKRGVTTLFKIKGINIVFNDKKKTITITEGTSTREN